MVSWVSAAVSALTVGGTATGLAASRRSAPEPGVDRGGHPLWWWLGCVAVIYLNQVLVTVYVLRVHHGDPSFIARYLPPGWFALEHGPLARQLAAWWPGPTLLAPSVLRVQAFLEFPFVLFGYLTVCRWFGPALYRRALRLRWPVAASYTATFCVIELSLPNPDTAQDIAIRLVSAVVTGLVTGRLSAPGSDPESTPLGLGRFAVSVAALAYLVLIVYDTALLYNLGHLAPKLPRIAAAVFVLAAARRLDAGSRTASARHEPPRFPRLGVVDAALGWFLVVFFVSALPIRYGLGFGVPALSLIAGAALIAAAGHAALRDADRRAQRAGWLVVAGVSGIAVGLVGYWGSGGYPEARILAAAGGCLIAVTSTALAIDLREHRRTTCSSSALPAAAERMTQQDRA